MNGSDIAMRSIDVLHPIRSILARWILPWEYWRSLLDLSSASRGIAERCGAEEDDCNRVQHFVVLEMEDTIANTVLFMLRLLRISISGFLPSSMSIKSRSRAYEGLS